jgi:hypothetical protein
MVGIHIAQLSAVSSVLPGSGPTSRRAFSRFTGFGASISAACPSITFALSPAVRASNIARIAAIA